MGICFPNIPGPTGPTGPAVALQGLQVQLVLGDISEIAANANVLFNNLVNNSSPFITYNAATGVFTILTPGTYYINWWVAVDGAAASPIVSFSIVTSTAQTFTAASAIVSTQVVGNALITALAPLTFALNNTTGDTAFIPDLAVQASLVVLSVG